MISKNDLPIGPDSRRPPTALVTGSSSGIGRELAKVLARHGYDLALIARREPLLCELARDLRGTSGVRAEVFAADLSDPAAPQSVFDAVRQRGLAVDVLVNNAGFACNGPFAEADL